MLWKIAKKTLVVMLVLITALITFIYWPKPNLKPFGQPKYYDKFNTQLEPTFFDYDQALKVAKDNDRLLLVNFTGHGCVSSREILYWPSFYLSSRKFIENKLVFCELYVDEKTIQLDTAEWFYTSKKTLVKSYDKKNRFIQESKFDTNAQPFFALIDPKSDKTIETFSYASKNRNTFKLIKAYIVH